MAYEMGSPFIAGGNARGKATATAGTVINVWAGCSPGLKARVSKLVYLCGSTAHVLTFMRPLGNTYLTANAAASQAVIAVNSVTPTQPNPNPGALPANAVLTARTIATNDWLLIRQDNGTLILAQVSSVSGKNITLTANLTTAITAPILTNGVPAINGKVWMMGVSTDTDLVTGLVHPQLDVTLSVVNTFSDDFAGIMSAHAADDPVLIQSNNVTAAGFFENVAYFLSQR